MRTFSPQPFSQRSRTKSPLHSREWLCHYNLRNGGIHSVVYSGERLLALFTRKIPLGFAVLIAVVCALAMSAQNSFAQFNKANLATKLGMDSTIFTMKLDTKKDPKPGQSFKLTIHVTPGREWHVYSSKMSSDGGLTPLMLKVPPELSQYFEITKVEESGNMHTSYDSNFMAVTMAHYTPFDVIATVKVLKKSDGEIPFYLLVHYQTCTETMCMPPRTFAVPMTIIGQEPIKLNIAGFYSPLQRILNAG